MLVATVELAVVVLAAQAAIAPAAAVGNQVSCPGAQNLGTSVPVLLVHGFTATPAMWTTGSPSMATAITSGLGGTVTVVPPFDYSSVNTDWVNAPGIGPDLGARISCLAKASTQQGGPGKVIIVAHSMGGLAVRCAVDPGCAGATTANSDQIGLVVTMDTPNLGATSGVVPLGLALCSLVTRNCPGPDLAHRLAPLGRLLCSLLPGCLGLMARANTPAALAMDPGSQALAKLPLLPASVPVDAIAGKITLRTSLFGGGPLDITGLDIGDVGDIAVPVASALADGQDGALHSGPGSGSVTVPCGSIPVNALDIWGVRSALLHGPAVDCWHLTEATDPVWQADVVQAIVAAAAAASLRACTAQGLTSGINAANQGVPPWTMSRYACQDGYALAQVSNPSTGFGYAVLKQTASGWQSVYGLDDGTCLFGGCPGFTLPLPASLLKLLTSEAGITPQTTSPSPTPSSATTQVTVSASGGWVNTGLQVASGDVVTIHAHGSWTPDGVNYTGPNGFGSSPTSADNFFNLTDLGACADCATTHDPNWSALIGYTGNSPPAPGSYTSTTTAPQARLITLLSDSFSATWPYSGELWLGFNDDAYSGNVSDNSGQVTADITVHRS
jgi:hypothetical protein